jgi:hypothetical protein
MRGQELIFHCAMIECETAEEAVAAYKPEPGDRVEFAGWDVPRSSSNSQPPIFSRQVQSAGHPVQQ